MTKAEEAALKAYPKKDRKVRISPFGMIVIDEYALERKAFQEGYEQAQEGIINLLQSRILELQELINKIKSNTE